MFFGFSVNLKTSWQSPAVTNTEHCDKKSGDLSINVFFELLIKFSFEIIVGMHNGYSIGLLSGLTLMKERLKAIIYTN